MNEPVLLTWIIDGPRKEDNLLNYMVAHVLWWRIWGVLLIGGLLPLFVGLWVYQNIQPMGAIFATWLVTSWVEPYVMKISPKYEVTKNY